MEDYCRESRRRRAEGDGYTVLATTTALAVNATVSRNKGYAVENFKTVAVVASTV
jgi:hypothetical protein